VFAISIHSRIIVTSNNVLHIQDQNDYLLTNLFFMLIL